MTKRKKIAIFCGYYLPHLGGVERYVDRLSQALSAIGYDIIIVTSNHDGLREEEVVSGNKVYRIPTFSLAKERYPIPRIGKSLNKIIKKIDQENPDYYILNTRFHLTSHLGAFIAKKNHKPALLIEHGTGHFTINNPVLDKLGQLYEHITTVPLKMAIKKYYGVSQNCNKWLKHFSIRASGVFYNSVSPEDGRGVARTFQQEFDENNIVITYAGRLLKEKGIINLLDAFSSIQERYPQARLAVAGEGPLLEQLKRDYTFPSIDFLGKLDFKNVMSLYERTDIFIYPSQYPEGLPTSILEAGLMGCVVIATPRGGTEEVIIDENHGTIVSGSVDSIKSALSNVMDHPAKRKLMAENLKERVANVFTWDKVAKSVDKELRGLE